MRQAVHNIYVYRFDYVQVFALIRIFQFIDDPCNLYRLEAHATSNRVHTYYRAKLAKLCDASLCHDNDLSINFAVFIICIL